jgi:hypothetical protein
LTLTLTSKNIELWHNELVEKFTPEITNHLKLAGKVRTPSDINNIINFCKTIKNSSVAVIYTNRIDEIITRYQRGDFRKLVNDLSVEKLNNIKELVRSFSLKTLEEKDLYFSLQRLNEPYSGESAAHEIYDWLGRKGRHARDIGEIVSEQVAKLNFDQSKIWDLYDRLQK